MEGDDRMKKSYTESLSHTTWECKYHIVFAPKFRRQEIYGSLKQEIGLIIRELCVRKEVVILETEACKDHIHLLVSIPPKISVSSFMGYFVSTVGKNKKMIAEYIRNQLKEDIISDQMTIKE